MGGLRKYMPITWITSLLGSLALIGIAALRRLLLQGQRSSRRCTSSHLPGAGFAYFAVLAGVFVTAFYSFRMYFLVFHGEERFDQARTHARRPRRGARRRPRPWHHEPHESPWVVTVPLILLAIPSVVIGCLTIEPMLFGDFFKDAIVVDRAAPAMANWREEFHGALAMALHGLHVAAVLAGARRRRHGLVLYLVNPDLPARDQARASARSTRCSKQVLFDGFNEWLFAGGARALGHGPVEGRRRRP